MEAQGTDIRRGPGARALLLGVLAAFALGAGTPGEYQVKAAFLYNFAKFVEWPAGANAEFVICVIGSDAVVDQLETVVDGKTAGGAAVQVRRLQDASTAQGCQILYLTDGAKAADAWVPGILTVGETRGFAQHGGMINFVIVNKKVRFEVNKKSAEAAGLSISSHLLKLAHEVIE